VDSWEPLDRFFEIFRELPPGDQYDQLLAQFAALIQTWDAKLIRVVRARLLLTVSHNPGFSAVIDVMEGQLALREMVALPSEEDK
jgi:hypothetical protein